jgi:hypothetical protein
MGVGILVSVTDLRVFFMLKHRNFAKTSGRGMWFT